MFGNTRPFSYSPRGFSQDDLPQQRKPFQQDDLRGAPLQRHNMSRPSGKSIYMQRKEYSEVLNRHSNNFHVRVEHLITCELDGQELKTLDGCLAKLKILDAKGRLWPQEMIMEVQGGYLLLSDIETKVELDAMPLSCILQTKAVLDSCSYNSLLTVTMQERNKRQVFIFQCEETGAGLIKNDLDKAVQTGSGDVEPRRHQSDIRSNLESIIGQHVPGSFRQPGPRPVEREKTPPTQDHPAPQWSNREPENRTPPGAYTPQEATVHHPDLYELQSSPGVALSAEQTDVERDTDILNHVINDMEIFMDKVSAAANAPSVQENKSNKKNVFKKKKSKKNAPAFSLPPLEEYIFCLQKIKYGFNLLGQLDGSLTSPSAPDYVHIFFTSLAMLVPQYPADLPPTVLSPLLTEATVQLLSQVVSPEEDGLWTSLGDCWNIPRSRWLDEDIPPYIPEFYDGWQPPPCSPMPSPLTYQDGPMSRSNSQRFPPGRGMQEPMTNSPWSSPPPPPPPRPTEPPLYMRVIYDFMARNNQELSILKGDVVQVVQKSKQWWLVRNARDEEGNVPQNVLEQMESTRPMEDQPRGNRGPVTLDMTSTPLEVRAWLEYKGFSKITVTSLGVLTGKLLLGMSKHEMKIVCPEEGGMVFFQLQAIKSAIALASEPSGLYNSHY
ncbi:epidermal growth factor receptor kinase substrate 8-like protein 3b [Enoplosus armatus]|uniref:epidermal growth factor receptor kinase substrate 8-like protein 3b n=1 Tax=Enoplosus armatus TaxID=215367 RepID=UPI0039930FA7